MPTLAVGAEVAGYRIQSIVGRGGMGVVYLAEHLRLKRRVALKVLAPELTGDQRFRDRFIQESELAASLEHPSIVPIHDAGEADGLLYIAMRYVEGTDLKAAIERDGMLSPERTVAIVSQVASALDAAHAKGLIHRDVKPANILISREADGTEHAYLTDFGLTKRPDQTTGLTRTGQFMGSVDYAAPEQFEGKPLDARTDVYSLGCVAFECLTGEVPFRRDQEAAVMYAHLKEPAPKPSALRPELGTEADGVLGRAMAKAPERRHSSCGALSRELHEALVGTSPAPPGRTRGPRRAVIATAAAIAVAAGLAVAFLASRGSNSNPGAVPTSPRSVPAAFAGLIELRPDGHPIGPPIGMSFLHSDTLFEKQIAVGEGFVWVGDGTANLVRKVRPSGHAVISTVTVAKPLGFAFGPQGVWMSQGSPITNDRSIVSLDPTTNSLSAPFDLGVTCCGGVAYAARSVWELNADSLIQADPLTGKILKTLDVGGDHLVQGAGKLWAMNSALGTLTGIDPRTYAIEDRISLGGSPTCLGIGFGAAWVCDRAGTVARIPLSGGGGTDVIDVGEVPNDVAIGDGAIWVANAGDGTVSMIPGTGGVATAFRVGGVPTHLAIGAGGIWVLVEGSLPQAVPG